MRGRRIQLALVSLLVAAALAGVACFTTPPPDLPALSAARPAILHSSCFPPADGTVLTELPPPPEEFVVPVVVSADESFQWDVYVDYDPVGNPDPRIWPTTPQQADYDGGTTWVSFPLTPADFEPGPCPHRIEFFVAHQFNPTSPRTPESYGGDSVAWTYDPAGCLDYDAGDGAFPEEAEAGGLPVAPESGADP